MCEKKSGWIRYPWKNVGDAQPRMKIVRYEYFAPWDWIVAVGSYEDEFYAEANLIKGRIFWSMAALTTLLSARRRPAWSSSPPRCSPTRSST